MCGIVGLFAKSAGIEKELGAHLSAMLIEMTDRGPDSAGVAFYREPADSGAMKLVLQHPDMAYDWSRLATDASQCFGETSAEQRANHAVIRTVAEFGAFKRWLGERHAEVGVVSAGAEIEIYKEVGLPADLADGFALRDMSATHGLGHTRMATESAVTTRGSHPFSTGQDLCLVHNGSLSNHNRLREKLRDAGIAFQTENDTEVAAGYLSWRMQEGDSLRDALEAALVDLDGFYTFAVGSRDGFAVLRDPIACKHAVMAETDEWVAMSTEYRAIAGLPGAAHAEIWEPAPATIYDWNRA